MNNETWLSLIFALSALDAMRDGFRADGYIGITNKQWHWIKWLGWYPLMVNLAFRCTEWYQIVFIAPALGWLGWRFGLLFTHRKWDSFWFTKAYSLWIRLKNKWQK